MPELTLQAWVDTVCRETGLDPSLVDIATVLDLAKDAAHGIARPAAATAPSGVVPAHRGAHAFFAGEGMPND